MFKKFSLATTVLLLLIGQTGASYAKNEGVKMIEEAIETSSLTIIYDLKTGKGEVRGAICDACEEITVKITPATQAFNNDRSVPMSEAKKRFGKPATVMFDKESKEVTRIRW